MRRIPFEGWLVVLILVVNLYAAFVPANSLSNWFSSDDAFYYFKTAQNISEGHGITFDRLGRDSGFHPLWMAVLVPVFALARYDLILPLRLVVIISGFLCAGTSVLLYRLARRALTPLAAALAALLWAFLPVIHEDVTELGLEAALSAFLIALLVYRVAQTETMEDEARLSGSSLAGFTRALLCTARRHWLTGLVAGLAVLARLDNIFLVFILGLWLSVRPRRLRYLLVADLFLVSLGVFWSYMARVGFGPQYAQSAASSYWMVVTALVVRLVMYYGMGLYRSPQNGWRGLPRLLGWSAIVSLLSSVIISGLMLGFVKAGLFTGFPRLVLVYEAGFALAAVTLSRLAAAVLEGRAPGEPEPVRWLPILGRLVGFFAPVAILLVIYMGASLWYFGTPSPVSGQIKRWWGTLPNTIYGRPITSLKEMLGGFSHGNSPWRLILVLVSQPAFLSGGLRLLVAGSAALGLLLARRVKSAGALHQMAVYPLLVGGLVQLISYTGTGYLHVRNWYWVAQLMVTVLGVSLLAEQALALVEQSRFYRRASTVRWLIAGLCVVIVIYGAYGIFIRMPALVVEENREAYLSGVRQLEEYTEPGSIIGSTGGGVIAYFIQDRTIVNLDGLMNTREYFSQLKQGKASQYLDAIGMDYVFASETVVTDSDPYFQFKGRMRKLRDFGGSTLLKWQ